VISCIDAECIEVCALTLSCLYSDDNRMLFQTFKMRLHEDHNGGEPMAYASNGSAQPLLKLIMLSLKYVKEEAMEEINRSQPRAMSARDIKWVVTGVYEQLECDRCTAVTHGRGVECSFTVPAIWRDSAKGLMRRAAFGTSHDWLPWDICGHTQSIMDSRMN